MKSNRRSLSRSLRVRLLLSVTAVTFPVRVQNLIILPSVAPFLT